MAKKLHYNIERMRNQADAIERIAKDLSGDKSNLTKMLSQLREEWRSTAGDKFFESYDTSWIPYIDKYCAMLNEVAAGIRLAANKYEPITEEYKRIRLDV